MKNRLECNTALYEKVFLIRSVEEKIRRCYCSDLMKTPVHLSLGEEAIVAGVCQALAAEDQVYGTYRSHALYLAKGGGLDRFFAEMYGKACGVAGGKAGSMHLSDTRAGFMASSAVVSTILPVAMGAAMAMQYRDEQRVAAVFFGDGATEEGAFWETLNMARLKGLPLLFVCENNGLAIHAPIDERQAYRLADVAGAFDLDYHESDTTDAEAVYRLAAKARSTILARRRPVFLHLHYHRYLEHVGINEDYEAGYRCKSDAIHWLDRDPVSTLRDKLVKMIGDPSVVDAMEKRILAQIDDSVAAAEAADYPPSEELYKGL